MRLIAIVGSMRYPDLSDIDDFVATLPGDAVIISGGTPAIVGRVAKAAGQCGLRFRHFGTEIDQDGRRSTYARNNRIVTACTELVVFWDGHTRTTSDIIKKARECNKSFRIFVAGKGWVDE